MAREYITSVHIDYRKSLCVCLHFSSTERCMILSNNFLIINFLSASEYGFEEEEQEYINSVHIDDDLF